MPGVVGTEETRLIVLRGNSASGKSSVAAGLRERYGRNLALVGQDNLRRTVLREHDRPGAASIGLIGMETAIDAASTLDGTVQRILSDTGLDGVPATDR
ncbi:hypothetical protein [Streptomyces sp. Je 1-332]|uniref:hypothetical protein n=1 Tax=Streptomyces sp. Je 1-332 TaxID=3231270 RepID=UPI00345887CD